jgi:hypothetical protein
MAPRHGRVSPQIQMKSNGRSAKINGRENFLAIFTRESRYDIKSSYKMRILSSLSKLANFTDSISRYSGLTIPESVTARPDSSNILDSRLDVHFLEI